MIVYFRQHSNKLPLFAGFIGVLRMQTRNSL